MTRKGSNNVFILHTSAVECITKNSVKSMVAILMGMNTLNDLFNRGLAELKSDTVYCMSYNANLDYVLTLIDRYGCLKKVVIYANNETITTSELTIASFGAVKRVP